MEDNKLVLAIENLSNEKRKELNIEEGVLIRDEVFEILQKMQCIVLYYPLMEEDECDACHIEKPVNGHMENFVFINSHNTRERQAFSAAHELGHIWKIDETLRKLFPERKIDTEDVINKFAAELLMPRKIFMRILKEKLYTMDYQGPMMRTKDMVKLIAYLMNYFFVPFKSVVIRFNEIGRLQRKA